MADNKYITQTQEHGSVLISEEVLVNIISLAVAEVEGAELSGLFFLSSLFPPNNSNFCCAVKLYAFY